MAQLNDKFDATFRSIRTQIASAAINGQAIDAAGYYGSLIGPISSQAVQVASVKARPENVPPVGFVQLVSADGGRSQGAPAPRTQRRRSVPAPALGKPRPSLTVMA